ncbi:HEXXH motif-containing putative peptide modification protein [Dactylosporangium siamense]|uniref:HEXXH motif domain-containing protein n=1 Tax=Dactylosporangium siamense TaxID=685454 RepID=UPI0023B332C3|nr:HEXXH motif domain-containing protein [Dactylosporangium siamense]
MFSLLGSVSDGTMVDSPLAGLDTAWALLARASDVDRDVTEDLMGRPEVGVWASHTLRRLRRNPPSDIPLWAELGYLHALAAAAAIRTGLTAELDIPVRHGTAVIPTVGSAMLPLDSPFGTAHVRTGPGGTEISASGAVVRIATDCPAWHEPIRVRVGHDETDLRVELADRDAYRDLRGPSAPRPLHPAETARWRSMLSEAWAILIRDHQPAARAIAAGIRVLSPVPAKEPFRQLSASGGEAFGGMLLSFPDDSTQLAVTLVHEFQHQKLGALLHLLTLTTDEPSVRYYAGWRDDPRPAGGLLQGAYAFAGVTEFWRTHRFRCRPAAAALAHFEFALWRRQTLRVLRTLAGSGRLTGHGSRFVGDLLQQVEEHEREPVPRVEATLAADLALDHEALWRAHNIVVPDLVVADLVAAWARGASAPIPAEASSAVRATPDVGLLDSRAVLARYRLTRASAFEQFQNDPETVSASVLGASAADVALIAGDREAAGRAYRVRVETASDDVHGLVGLGLSRPDRTADPVARALLRRPELVRAMAARLSVSGAVDVVRLAAWIGAALPPDRPDPIGWRAV